MVPIEQSTTLAPDPSSAAEARRFVRSALAEGGAARQADELVEVRILGMPVAAYQRACQYDEELLRELMLAASRPPGAGCLPPAGLTALIDELGQGFPQYTDVPQADVEAARARGAE